MRKIKLFAVATALILTGFGGWIASTPYASVAAPVGSQVDALDMMKNAKELPLVEYHDFSLVFD